MSISGVIKMGSQVDAIRLRITIFAALFKHDLNKFIMDENTNNNILEEVTKGEYKFGFFSDIETDYAPKGLTEDTIRFISAKKEEPEWMLEFRLKAFRHWLTLEEPEWAHLHHPPIDFQEIIYYASPRKKPQLESLDEVDPELLETFDKLGISLDEQKRLSGVAVDAVIDSVSVKTTFQDTLSKHGIIFCSFSEAVKNHPDLVKKYMGTVVPYTDNYYAALNSAVFSDGSFCFIPKGVRSPLELSTYFRINAANTGQFERTLIVAEEGGYVSYMEGCTAPMRDENQLHAAIVEIIAMDDAEVKYSTVQNWYPGNKEGKGGVYNFVTKRGLCKGNRSKISWTQVETGSSITWKYPSCVLLGDHSIGEFYSVAVTNNFQQADTGSKMIHLGKNTRSTIISKGISAGKSNNSYRGLVKIMPGALNARNFSQCDSLLLGDKCGAHTFPYIDTRNQSSIVEHEATTSKISEDQLFYCNQRGIDTEKAIGLIVNGYAKEVLNKLPMEFAVEAQKLLSITLEGSVG
jgi:Fe-S cluster assembly protein SufB